MKEQYELEFVFPVSAKLLYQLVSTEEGLSKWFADRVDIQKEQINFYWSKQIHEAKILGQKECKFFKFSWSEDIEDSNEYFVEFAVNPSGNDNSTVLKITDFTESDEKNENILLWNTNIDQLKRAMGING